MVRTKSLKYKIRHLKSAHECFGNSIVNKEAKRTPHISTFPPTNATIYITFNSLNKRNPIFPTSYTTPYRNLNEKNSNLTSCILYNLGYPRNKKDTWYHKQIECFNFLQNREIIKRIHHPPRGKFTRHDIHNLNQNQSKLLSYRQEGMSSQTEPIDIDQAEITEAEEDRLLDPNQKYSTPNQSKELEQKIFNISDELSGLGVGSSTKNFVNDPLSKINPPDLTSTPQNKRTRINNDSVEQLDMTNPNPTKKLRTLMNSTPSMADVVKNEVKGHVIDIYTEDGNEDMTMEQSNELQEKLNEALFQEEVISSIKFDETPHYDGM